MFLSPYVIAITFRLLNVVLLFVLIVYTFKKYALQGIRDKIKEHDVFLAGLRKQKKILKQEHDDAQQQYAQQERFFTVLKNNINVWQRAVEQQKAVCRQEHEQRAQAITKKMNKQLQEVALERIRQEKLPDIVRNARNTLEKEYTQEQGEVFLQSLIKRLGKEQA